MLRPERIAVCRLAPQDALPTWATTAPFFSVTRTPDELTVVTEESCVPETVSSERGWRAIQVQGPPLFHLVGILVALAVPLAEAGISIFALSTFDTDYVLVRAEKLNAAITALEGTGHYFASPCEEIR